VRLYEILQVAPSQYICSDDAIEHSGDTKDGDTQDTPLSENDAGNIEESLKRQRSQSALETIKNSRRKLILEAAKRLQEADVEF
jgi:hypothetical protein